MKLKMNALVALLLLSIGGVVAAEDAVHQPFPRAVYKGELVHRFATDKLGAGVTAAGTAEAKVVDGHRRFDVTGADPQIILSGFPSVIGPLCLSFRARLTGGGMGVLYWGDKTTPGFNAGRQVEFLTEYDNTWHDHIIAIPARSELTDLRLDLGSERGGTIEIADIALHRGGLHPLEMTTITQHADNVTATVQNHSGKAIAIRFDKREINLPANSARELRKPLKVDTAIQAVDFRIEVKVAPEFAGVPTIRRQLWVHNPKVKIDAVTLERGDLRLDVARDGSLARIHTGGRLQVVMAPLALVDGRLPKWAARRDGKTIRLSGDASAAIRFEDDGVLSMKSDASAEMEVVVRALGHMEQAIFPGLEYLGKGERSSSRLDITTDQHFRFMPAIKDITWPALMMVTDRQSFSLRWNDGVRPTFASPNFVDGAADHRVTLRGKAIQASLRITEPAPIAASILRVVRELGLPPLPKRPRNDVQQAALCRQAFDGPLRSKDGWGHCVEGRYTRRWYADLASSVWALGGDLSDLPDLVPGGGHIRDDRSFFLTGRAQAWLQQQRAQAHRVLKGMQADGSFRYSGEFRKGHFENTASGHCGKQALTLLRFAERTGDAEMQTAGLKALDFIKRFRTPRGAQTWELSLHTPDIMAAAHLVEAFLVAYDLTGDKHYLAEARRWAASGLPFVYLQGSKPVQTYATIPVFGASHWVAPNWIGKPVQWNGLVYAHAIGRLANVDKSFPWHQVAKGIVIAAEQMQETDGPRVGCLPDYWFLDVGRGGGPAINPTVIINAADRAWGRADGLQTVRHDGRQFTGPFPFEVKDGELHVTSRRGANYQVVVEGKKIVNVTGTGDDVIRFP